MNASMMSLGLENVKELQAPQIQIFSEEPNENGLFHDDVTIRIEVTEKGQPCSGIQKITYKIYHDCPLVSISAFSFSFLSVI